MRQMRGRRKYGTGSGCKSNFRAAGSEAEREGARIPGSGVGGAVRPGEFGDDAEIAKIPHGHVPMILGGKFDDPLDAFVFRQTRPAGVEGFTVNAAMGTLLERGADGGLEMQDGPIHCRAKARRSAWCLVAIRGVSTGFNGGGERRRSGLFRSAGDRARRNRGRTRSGDSVRSRDSRGLMGGGFHAGPARGRTTA